MTKIHTTHVGSLPRTQKIVDFIFAREKEQQYDQDAFDVAMTEAVDETVRKQVEAGINYVSDGETSKISYATYVKDRYTGFSTGTDRGGSHRGADDRHDEEAWRVHEGVLLGGVGEKE